METVIERDLIEMFGQYFYNIHGQFSGEIPSLKPQHFNLAEEWIERLTKLFLVCPNDYLSQHRKLTLEIVERVRKKRAYYFFVDALKTIERKFNLPFPAYIVELREAKPNVASFLLTELLLIWALLEKEGRFLVCVKDGYQRKHFPLPENPEERKAFILQVGQQILAFLPFITPQHLDLIPDRFGPIHNVDKEAIRVPIIVNQSIAEILEDAYFHQRYVIHPVGAAVQLKNAYDIQAMLVKVIDGKIIAKISTSKGETIALVDLETAQGVDFLLKHGGPLIQVRDALALLVASVYHDLVVRIETPTKRKRKYAFRAVEGERVILPEEEPIFIYIPQKIRVGGEIKEVSPCQPAPFRRSPRPHQVREHPMRLWRGEMSEYQRRRVEEFERETGFKILEKLPPDHTFVLPFSSPKGAEVIAHYPLFIKRKVEAEMLSKLQPSS
ncbi:MAG: hypothetical protein AUJ31_00165 [Parcubacteria group bacterium CG1_02_39_15]|nr:MAG: hypothetical protein AUJ31_00165 [Parcubacteria group bacterium CG1_02_39_15]